MSGLAFPETHVSAYLQNIVDGRTMRDLARAYGCHPSTILRRIRRCEELRDHPEIDTLLTALEDHRMRSDAPGGTTVNRATVLAALNLNLVQVASEFGARMQYLSHPKGIILIGDPLTAAITVAGQHKGSLPKAVAIAALAFGWITSVGPHHGRVRMFRATETATECVDAAAPVDVTQTGPADSAKGRDQYRYTRRPLPLEAAITRKQDLITDDHLNAARQYQAIYVGRETAMADTYRVICQNLPPRLVTVLNEVCGMGTGFEALERLMKLPARSGKVLTVVALEALPHLKVI